MQVPFIAKNQIVLFMFSDDIFKLDELTQRVRKIPGVASADLFIPKKNCFSSKLDNQCNQSFQGIPNTSFSLPNTLIVNQIIPH